MLALVAFIVALLWLILDVMNVGAWSWLLPLVLTLICAHFAFGDRISGWRGR